ncbi:hypothetical protein CANTEDRAFT_133231 [Yamadazyma tenuis ATCC 10573]|uniref:Uncharacterized protein n=1 Tax=Candida tenuis (strain ATCC 10573 / BCRC 21748 / CBS 615 / JCM 9827 / NBRC 10315 / NRRL Y-1498 / VKM Y-70) TaxID=590646 RepID=G3AYB3_CANTC|nr:uncharacterized protein CANTEDRAFT_133231 [Yamadazyma tenuis ATCC 10573]EGV65811.1 hypothetical protein CANTEDRAFT_133231 [Yamadazyma tenuis ATCC 10573]
MNLFRILDSTPEPPIVDLEIDHINDSGEYNLTTPIYEFQRELTDQIVSLHYSDILKYCETNDKTELIVKSLEICIRNCMLVSSHPYLLITHYMPKNLLQRDMTLKLAETSGKFNVLKDLINVICRSCDDYNLRKRGVGKRTAKEDREKAALHHKHIGVVLSNINKLTDLVEALLIGNVSSPIKLKRYVGNYLRRDHKKNEPTNANVTVHLIPTDLSEVKEDLSGLKLDLVIKFDEFVPNDLITNLRSQNRSSPASLIKLIPMLSIEHCRIFYEGHENDTDYLYKLISSIVCLRDQIGILAPDIFPIYNQGLNYLTAFFNQMLESDSYPVWPLPGLPDIPEFSVIDVEKSLLTEVHFHYTPYDTDLTSIDDVKRVHKHKKPKNTYYQMNRLKSNYITNPLMNNFDNLIGIFNHNLNSTDFGNHNHSLYLTHKLMMQLNNIYLQYEVIKQEYDSHLFYNEDEVQNNRIGRRHQELAKTLSSLLMDVDHSSSRIETGNKKFTKKQEEIEVLRKDIEEMKQTIQNFKDHEDVRSYEKKIKLIGNQIKIWELTKSIEHGIGKIKSKQEEKDYMKTEYENSLKSIRESKSSINELEEVNENLGRSMKKKSRNSEWIEAN